MSESFFWIESGQVGIAGGLRAVSESLFWVESGQVDSSVGSNHLLASLCVINPAVVSPCGSMLGLGTSSVTLFALDCSYSFKQVRTALQFVYV